jgi:hypothetical protein
LRVRSTSGGSAEHAAVDVDSDHVGAACGEGTREQTISASEVEHSLSVHHADEPLEKTMLECLCAAPTVVSRHRAYASGPIPPGGGGALALRARLDTDVLPGTVFKYTFDYLNMP